MAKATLLIASELRILELEICHPVGVMGTDRASSRSPICIGYKGRQAWSLSAVSDTVILGFFFHQLVYYPHHVPSLLLV